MNKEITINKNNKSLTFINNGIAFSQFGIADEILDLIEDLQKDLKYQKEMEEEYNEKHIRLMKKYNKQKQVLDKIKEYCDHKLVMLEIDKRKIMEILTPENGYLKADIEIEMQKYKDILELLEEI